ncbi:Alkaline phosphatase-like protein [Ketogulonicigenium robustum]|uniref:Alkaline phosphatase-like protein n=1 Tax=Ketogulonicigenium robustum TaxID=92947 RepID=A0A1W6NYH6_9RHOB|nr:DedA family protein [Ketogulonicigenium robustum]ARO14306.1 Alkaline phosphatase-like protein [Ketogulonicigenium robustum]
MFDALLGLMNAGGAFGLALIMFLENVFPPVPSEVIIPLAGFLAASGRMALWEVIVAGVAGSVLGALFWYWIGLAVGKDRVMAFVARWGFILTISEDEAERAFAWFQRYGAWAVFFARVLPGVRTLISIPAGMARMSMPLFLVTTTLGSAIWVSILAGAGLLLRENYDHISRYIDPLSYVVIGAIVGIYVWRLLRQLRSRPKG